MSKRKHKQPRKPRNDAYYATVSTQTDGITVTIDPVSEAIIIHGADKDSERFVRGYQRESGKEKVVASMPVARMDTSFNLMKNLRNNYETLLAIDTNTAIIAGRRISVTFSYFTPNPLSSDPNGVSADPLVGFISLDCVDGLNPERLGWHLVLSNIVRPQHLSSTSRLCVIVDSELGLLESINKKEIPYFGNYFLPDHVQLVYASETDSDSFPCLMIKNCDSAARQVIEKIRDPSFVLPNERNGDEFHKGHFAIDYA